MDPSEVSALAWNTPVHRLHELPEEVLMHPAFVEAIIDGPGAGMMHLAKNADLSLLRMIRRRLHERAELEPRLQRFLDFCQNPSDPDDELHAGLIAYL